MGGKVTGKMIQQKASHTSSMKLKGNMSSSTTSFIFFFWSHSVYEHWNFQSNLSHILCQKLRYVYVWHAITGYWGGVRPGADGMAHYESKMQFPVSSPGVQKNEPCDALNSITTNGLGLVNPEKVFSFYNELHSYLASAGIDGVKVDVQNILETLGGGHGGRVLLARKYHQALEASIARNFPDNGIISCMSHNTDNLYR